MNMIDLSMTIKDHWRWQVESGSIDFDEGNGFRASTLSIGAHAFTHVDTPLHCRKGATALEQLPADAYSGEAAVIDLSHKRENDPITDADLDKARHVNTNEKIILLKTCWDRRYSPDSREYWSEAPYLTESGAVWLKKKAPRVVGFDFPQDYPLKLINNKKKFNLDDMPSHKLLLHEGILHIEYLCNMAAITTERVRFICLPLKIEGFEGSPARAVAIV